MNAEVRKLAKGLHSTLILNFPNDRFGFNVRNSFVHIRTYGRRERFCLPCGRMLLAFSCVSELEFLDFHFSMFFHVAHIEFKVVCFHVLLERFFVFPGFANKQHVFARCACKYVVGYIAFVFK